MRGFQFLKIISTNIQLCLIELFSNKMRSLLTSLGIFIGAVSLLANIAFVRAIDNDVKEKMQVIGGLNMITIKKKTAVTSKETRELNRSPGLTSSDASELKGQFNYVAAYIPQQELPWGPARANGKTAWASTNAVDLNYFDAYKVEIDNGRCFSSDDNTGTVPVCIVGTRVSSRLYGETVNPVGRIIILNERKFTIIGVIKSESKFSYRTRQIFIPFNYYQKNFGHTDDKVENIVIQLKNSTFTDQALADFSKVLLQRHRGIKDFEIESNTAKIAEMKKANGGIQIILYCIAVITLFIGGISIMNIMFAAIGDRIREIGIRKSLGAAGFDIIIQFLIEAMILCCIGGIPGMIVGGAVTLFPLGFFPFNPQLLPSDYLISLLFIVVTGLVSGLFPAIKASSMQPAEALRY